MTTTCEQKLTQILSVCDGSTTDECSSILNILESGNQTTTFDEYWGQEGNTTFVWQMIGIGVLLLWFVYWIVWFWMAGGMGTERATRKVGEKKTRANIGA